MNASTHPGTTHQTRGARWLRALCGDAPQSPDSSRTVRVQDAPLGGEIARYISVVPDADNPFPRARNGETGLLEGWELAKAVRGVIDVDADVSLKRPIVAIVDVPSQAYGRREEAYGLHQSLAAAVDAYASARLQGHPVIALFVGHAMSGALLAHGYQANRIIAFNDTQVVVHAMGKAAAARITARGIDELDALTADVPPMAYDIRSYASLGLLWNLIDVAAPDAPGVADIEHVASVLRAALLDIRQDASRGLENRLHSPLRAASREVRARLRTEW